MRPVKLTRAILKFQRRFSRAQLVFRGMFRKQKCSLGSYLIVGKEKSEKNHFENLLELFGKKDEISSLTLTPRRGRGLRSLVKTSKNCVEVGLHFRIFFHLF